MLKKYKNNTRKDYAMFQNDTNLETNGKKKIGRPIKERKKKQYTLTMDEDFHDEVMKKAEEMGLSFSSFVCMSLKTHLQN